MPYACREKQLQYLREWRLSKKKESRPKSVSKISEPAPVPGNDEILHKIVFGGYIPPKSATRLKARLNQMIDEMDSYPYQSVLDEILDCGKSITLENQRLDFYRLQLTALSEIRIRNLEVHDDYA